MLSVGLRIHACINRSFEKLITGVRVNIIRIHNAVLLHIWYRASLAGFHGEETDKGAKDRDWKAADRE